MRYATAMIPAGVLNSTANAAERMLRADLARAEEVRASIGPVLRHLVSSDDLSVFSEEAVARTRGLIEALAGQLLRAVSLGAGQEVLRPGEPEALIAALVAQPALLAHCHALALEGQLTERLAGQARLDPVLSPLLQTRLAAPDPDVAALAMHVLAAQTRFMQAQRRMEVAPGELPADVLHPVLVAFDAVCGAEAAPAAMAIRSRYDEARSRHGLLARLVLGLGGDAAAALDPLEAGLAIFLTALSLATMQERDRAVLALVDGQQARLATMLAAAGASPQQVEACLLLLHPDLAPERRYLGIGRNSAEVLLAGEGQP